VSCCESSWCWRQGRWLLNVSFSLYPCLCLSVCVCVGNSVDKGCVNVASFHTRRTTAHPWHAWVENVMVRSASSVAGPRTNGKSHSTILLTDWFHRVSTDCIELPHGVLSCVVKLAGRDICVKESALCVQLHLYHPYLYLNSRSKSQQPGTWSPCQP